MIELREVPARNAAGRQLSGAGSAKIVAGPDLHGPLFQEFTSGRVELGLDKRLTAQLQPGDVIALAVDGSGAVVLGALQGGWDNSDSHPLHRWVGRWADDWVPGSDQPWRPAVAA